MEDPMPVLIRYPMGFEELGIRIDHEWVDGGQFAAALILPGDIIEIDDVPRRVIEVKRSLATGRPGIEGAGPTARIRHEPPGRASL